jgi:hypothetical protein
MSLRELFLAIDGYREANMGEENKPFTKDELQDLMERYPD